MAYSDLENIVIWQYFEHPNRWVIACLLFIQILFVSAQIFSDIKLPLSTGDSVQSAPTFWINLLILLFLIIAIFIFLRPRVSGHFRVIGERFEYDSGLKAINVLSYVSDFISHFKKPTDIFSKNLFLSMGLIPKRVLLSGGSSEISELKLEVGTLGTRVSFLYQEKTLIVIDDLSEEYVQRIYGIVKSVIGSPTPRTTPQDSNMTP